MLRKTLCAMGERFLFVCSLFSFVLFSFVKSGLVYVYIDILQGETKISSTHESCKRAASGS